MSEPTPPPAPPENSYNYNQRDPNEPSAAAKIGFVVAGIVYTFIIGVIVAFCAGNLNNIHLTYFVLIVLLSLPVASFFFKGYRFFGLGVLLMVVFGCLLPLGAVFVICGRMGNVHP